jgi:hypothetical protein
MINKCNIPSNVSWQAKHKPVSHYINKLIERYYKTQPNWYYSPMWEKRAIFDYAEQLANRWKRITNCHCQDK